MADIEKVPSGSRAVSRRAVVGTSAAEVFALVDNPHRHGELDGSGTVGEGVSGPEQLDEGDTFSVKMKKYGLPYRITSTVTAADKDRLLEWRHPAGHRWRYEIEPLGDHQCAVTETFDYAGSKAPKVLELLRTPADNAKGIEATLRQLQQRYS